MTERLLRISTAALLIGLSGCAGAGAQMDRLNDRIESRSTCHTSNGQWAGVGRTCTISHSATSSSTTTTVVTTPPAPASDAEPDR